MRLLFIALVFCMQWPLLAQDDQTTLLTINQEPIYVSEFKRVYEKNLDLVEGKQERDPSSYLDLFIAYKLKVQEAYRLELDKKSTYKKELASYRKQLIKNYLTDVKVTEELVQEAYDRTKEERRARHILIRVQGSAMPGDTLLAFNKIISARERIISGEDFDKVAREVSEDPSARANGGDLGYFNAFKMVYPFENASYTTSIGAVSEPFRTRFGYHIVQPTETRMSNGTVTVAHIMVNHKQVDTTIIPKNRIQEVYTQLENGAAFEALAENYSDDKNSATKGGVLKPIEQGSLSAPAFEKRAFEKQAIGTYSEPFETKFGWHILKYLERTPVPPYEDLKKSLQQRIIKDARAQVIDNSLNEELRKYYKIGDTKKIAAFFMGQLPEDYKTAVLMMEGSSWEKTALSIGDSLISYKILGAHLTGRAKGKPYSSKEAFVTNEIDLFTTQLLRTYHENNLEYVDPVFKAILREYQEGLLLFDLLQSQIWDRAKNDSIGLQQFFVNNKAQFKSAEQVEVIQVTLADERQKKKVKKLLKKSQDIEALRRDIKGLSEESIVVTKTFFVSELPSTVSTSVGEISLITTEVGLSIVKVLSNVPAQDRELNEVKGLVTSAYQKKLEEALVARLRSAAKITINKGVLAQVEESYND